jgi:hypothetical protein
MTSDTACNELLTGKRTFLHALKRQAHLYAVEQSSEQWIDRISFTQQLDVV